MSSDRLYGEALARFDEIYARAAASGLRDHTAVTLATADRAGRPSARTVLLKGFDERGFVFYTNECSRKGRHLAENPRAALLFFWQTLFEQVHVEGPVAVVPTPEADAYWATRSRESQLGAWASHQSETLTGRAELESRLAAMAERFAREAVPRPPHWRGYRVTPERIEFWQSREHRLHDRQCYERGAGGWTMRLLNP
jgi:pyridoxamine 5'-phosphate oxidase